VQRIENFDKFKCDTPLEQDSFIIRNIFCPEMLRKKFYRAVNKGAQNEDTEQEIQRSSKYRCISDEVDYMGKSKTLAFFQLQACCPFVKMSTITRMFYCVINTDCIDT